MIECPPPKFRLFVNKKSLCSNNYIQYIENQLRDAFYPEAGMPITIELRERASHTTDVTNGKRQAAAGAKRKKEDKFQAERRRATSSKRRKK